MRQQLTISHSIQGEREWVELGGVWEYHQREGLDQPRVLLWYVDMVMIVNMCTCSALFPGLHLSFQYD